MDPSTLFNEKLPEAIAKNPDKARSVGAVYLFKITGDGGGEWTVDLASATPTCLAGAHGASQCTVEIGAADLMVLLGNEAMAMPLFIQGKLKVGGDVTLAMKLQKLFRLASA